MQEPSKAGMAEDNDRRRKVANDIMAQACLPEVLVTNGVHVAVRDAIIEALEQEHAEGWNAAMGSAVAEGASLTVTS